MSSYAKRIVLRPASPVIDWMKPFEGYHERRIPVLYFLDYIFKALAVLNDAYRHMFPAPPPHPPCQHEPQQQGHRHLADMAGQGERMAFVGLLLRTIERIIQLKADSLDKYSSYFAREVKKLKGEHPEIARGVAVLNFLTAGLCSNDPKILFGLLHLVQALKEAGKSCEHHHCDVNFFAFYKNRKSNCTLTLLNKLLDQCSETRCDINCKICQEVQHRKAELEPHLDPSCWNECTDCESMLVDILVYAVLFYNTDRRMMASLRLSLNCPTSMEQNRGLLMQLKWLPRYLLSVGFVEIQHQEPTLLHNGCSVNYEMLFMSGWQYDKKCKEPMHLMLEAFLEQKNSRRLCFIQWKYQFIGDDGRSHCCEPQILDQLAVVMGEIVKTPLAQFIKVHTMLEQDPCHTCRREVMPVILSPFQSQLVSMLPFQQGSVFLERLTEDGGPVQLKDDLHPFEGRNACMVQKRCKHVRCQEYCHYSKPGKVLAVKEAKLRSLSNHKQESFCWFSLYPLPIYWVYSL